MSNNIFFTEAGVRERIEICRIAEDELQRIDIEVIPHYGWLPCFSLHFKSCSPIPPHNNTRNLGFILHTFLQLFQVREDGEYLSKFVNKRVRLVYSYDGYGERCVAVGHPYVDKFIFFEDLMKVSDTTYD